MVSRQGGYTVVCALHVLLLSTCSARTTASPPPASPRVNTALPAAPPRAPAASSAATPVSANSAPPAREAAPLEFFHSALERTKNARTKTHITFFGDSHTAADFMSGRVRERLQAEYGDGGPGFVMTGRPWRSYRHSRAELLEAKGLKGTYIRKRPESDALPLGLAGVAFAPQPIAEPEPIPPSKGKRPAPKKVEPAEPVPEAPLVRLRLTNAVNPSGRATHYEFFLLPGPLPHFAVDGQAPSKLPPAPALPDASTQGQYVAFDAPNDQPHDVTIASGLDVPLTWFGLVAELEGPGVVLDTLGIPGARARAQLYWDQPLFLEHLGRRTPDLWVLSYGTNESTDVTQPIQDYAAQLHEVVSRLRQSAPGASCLLVGPTDFPERIKKGVYQPRERTAQINELQRKTAAEFGCAYFDVIESMGGPLSMLSWVKADPPLGAKDLIHFTRRGYALLGDRIADRLLGVNTSEANPVAVVDEPAPEALVAPRGKQPKPATARSRNKD
ncbi:MAG: GDSL-type esterase/lipase family protein [Myxococcales bacterium]